MNEQENNIESKVSETDTEISESGVEETDVAQEEVAEETEKTETDEAKKNEKNNDDEDDVEKLTKKLTEKDLEAKGYLERLQRTMAEFDNFRKRTAKEKTAMYETGVKEAVEAILPVIDNFERALSTISDEEKENSFVQGVEMIYKQFMSALEGLGVKQIEALGKEFDPNYHNAVTHIEDDNFGENEVVEEFQKGYVLNDTVIRYSMVKVAN